MYTILGSDQKEYGPVGADQVRLWIIERRLNANALARIEGATDWKPLSSFPEFTSTLGVVTPTFLAQEAVALPTAGNNSMAVLGLISSSFGLLCCCCPAPLFSVLGIVFSCIGLAQINQNPREGGKPLAIAGIVLGGLGLLEFAAVLGLGAFGQLFEKLRR